ncbi:hypothetical protein M2306_001769 [Myroides gitamensis]|nr:hypothetical protein [Myroides gitamensis]
MQTIINYLLNSLEIDYSTINIINTLLLVTEILTLLWKIYKYLSNNFVVKNILCKPFSMNTSM